MANKQKKKRNKQYTGAGSTAVQPTVTRMSAVERSKLGQWWFDNKRIAKPIIIASAVVLLIALIIWQIVNLATAA